MRDETDAREETPVLQARSHVFRSTWSPTSVSRGKLPTRTTQPTSRIGTWTSTFAGLKEDTCTKDSLAADQR
ncbi:hypothetical protein TNCV_4235221 [Trichonephila clavipes]|nr:hypothetical protein TNCV_4235221 [Trichonephila clavipes]